MERKSLMAEFIVPVNQEHTVSGRDTEQGYESDDGRNADDLVRKENREYAADERQRQIQKHRRSLFDILELSVKKQEYHDYRHQ